MLHNFSYFNQSTTKHRWHPPLFGNPAIPKRCRKKSFATYWSRHNTDNIGKPLAGDIQRKWKNIPKFAEKAPAGRILAFHWNRYSFDKLIFLKYYNDIIIFDIVNKYLTPYLVTSNNPEFVSNIREFMSNIHDYVSNIWHHVKLYLFHVKLYVK